jgi:aldehyde:ferredoxin oxidoreductase
MAEIITNEVTTMSYERPVIDKGYANQYLTVDLSTLTLAIEPVSAERKNVFIGGKGFDLWLLWNAVSGSTKWNDAGNAVCIASGPLAGTPIYPGSGKSIVTTISPLTGSVIDSNVGGYFGPYLKFSGFDALQVVGKSAGDTVIVIDGSDENIRIYEIPELPEDSYAMSDFLTEHFSQGKKSSVSVVSTGPGAKHALMGCLNFSWFDSKRRRVRYKQAGRGGIGTVFADKGVKAIVARWGSVSAKSNNPADFDDLKSVGRLHSKEISELDPKQNEMAKIGTTHLVPIMNEFDLLPTHNFKYGQHVNADLIGSMVYWNLFDSGFDGCWKGCTVACAHGVKDFVPMTGPYRGKTVFVDGPEYETIAEYVSKESLAQQGGFGLALKGPQHDEAWLFFLDMVHNFMPTFEQKAETLHWFPMFRTWFGLCGLCKLPWNDIVPEDNKKTVDPAKVIKHVNWYAEYFTAVTGKLVTPDDLIIMSEAVYNFQRVFNLKMGYGKREHDSIPYRAVGPVTAGEYESRKDHYDKQLIEKYNIDIAGKTIEEKTALLRKLRIEQYDKLQDAVYERRGWTKDGIPTVETVRRLGIDFPEVLGVLKANGVE